MYENTEEINKLMSLPDELVRKDGVSYIIKSWKPVFVQGEFIEISAIIVPVIEE